MARKVVDWGGGGLYHPWCNSNLSTNSKAVFLGRLEIKTFTWIQIRQIDVRERIMALNMKENLELFSLKNEKNSMRDRNIKTFLTITLGKLFLKTTLNILKLKIIKKEEEVFF